MDIRFLEKLQLAQESGRPFAIVTLVEIVGSAPQEVGARMIVREDGSIEGTVGGGTVEFHLIQQARQAIADGEPRLLRINLKEDVAMACGGNMTAFIEPTRAPERVVVFGCGHVSRALAPLLHSLDFRLTVVDDRPEWAAPAAFPEGTEVICRPFDEVCQELPDDDDLFIAVMTRGHAFDYQLLEHFLPRQWAYLGIMASKGKAAGFVKQLAEKGLAGERLDEVAMPIGMPIGSQTPAEIAVSVAGQLVQARKARRKTRKGA